MKGRERNATTTKKSPVINIAMALHIGSDRKSIALHSFGTIGSSKKPNRVTSMKSQRQFYSVVWSRVKNKRINNRAGVCSHLHDIESISSESVRRGDKLEYIVK